jgi:hypothetical protein
MTDAWDFQSTTATFAQSPSSFVGKEIALWSPSNNRFMQMSVDTPGFVGVLEDQSVNPGNINGSGFDGTRFLVCDTGDGRVALWSTRYKRYLQCDIAGEVIAGIEYLHVDQYLDGNGGFGGIGGSDSQALKINNFEKFTVVDVGNGTVAFHNWLYSMILRMNGGNVDAKGGRVDLNKLPSLLEWESEQWEVVLF